MQRGRDGRPLITRAEAAERLQIRRSHVRSLELRDVLPERGRTREGHVLYDPVDVDAAAAAVERPSGSGRRSEGEIAALVYEQLDEGATERQIVRELELEPELVRRLHRAWADGDDVIVPAAVARACEQLLEDTIDLRWDRLLEQLGELRRKAHRCDELEVLLARRSGESEPGAQ